MISTTPCSETRRVAEEYGFRSVFLRSNIVNGKNWYDPYYEPLWNLLEELNLTARISTRRPRRARANARKTSSRTSACAGFTRNRSSRCSVSAAFLAAAFSNAIRK